MERWWLIAVLLCPGCVSLSSPSAPNPVEQYTTSWLPRGDPTAIVIGVHGLNDDHSGTFHDFGPYLVRHGMAFYAYDQRGFGRSSGLDEGRWAGGTQLVADLDQLVGEVSRQHPHLPLYLVGTSLGAAVVLNYVTSAHEPPVTGIVLVAPAVAQPGWPGTFPRLLLRLGAWLAPTMTVQRPETVAVADDPALELRLAKDPLVRKGTSLEVLLGSLELMEAALRDAAAVSTPSLVLAGERDSVVPHDAVCQLVAAMSPQVGAIFYPEGFHLLLRDRGHQAVWEDIRRFITERDSEVPRAMARFCQHPCDACT